MTVPNNEKNEKEKNMVTLDNGKKVTFDEALYSVQNGYIDSVNQGSGKYERQFLRDEEKEYDEGEKKDSNR